ncbi:MULTISPECIES: phosphoglycerate kinase [unclassified Beijerinckia]|uniref:phosphoglycerate kinase n=1 Tax=unclassified Beijerinckia TaxID=2638183 RepID=UPI0008960549|nr:MULTISPECIES: phosphoglycerate kinase [unclassified Beijerinckia]MDH7798507.1 phosphoglycerate kinase [Beijerinckia sp. GAS462]SED23187.1 phosphoglycerate kinase [Beijerinckia sp. 28-YEA-48]
MAKFRTLDDVDVTGKRVLLRVDLNLPVESGRVTDTTRLERIIPTMKEIISRGGRLILLSHFGRPKNGPDEDCSLKPLAAAVSEHLDWPVSFAFDCIGSEAQEAVGQMKDGDVLLLENTRFHAGEEKNDPVFVAELARLGDIYVNDGFSVAHRAHASTEGLAHVLPSAAGRSMQAELDALTHALDEPERPLAAIVGGAKVSSKLELLGSLMKKVEYLIIGGAMANTFFAAQGKKVGKSLVERNMIETASQILAKAREAHCTIVLPIDVVVAHEFKAHAPSRVATVDDVHDDEMILDIGPASIDAIDKLLSDVKTLVWNGPFGAFEISPFDTGTNAVAQFAAQRTADGELLTVAGGGDTVSALNQAGVGDKFSYISTAGGAFLEWLEGKALPGVEVLRARS